MFWQYENGTLLNLDAFQSIYFHQDGKIASVRGKLRGVNEPSIGTIRPDLINLFSSEDAELVKRVLLNITNGLEHEELLIRETQMKTL